MATAAPEIPVLARDQAFESLYRRYVTDVYHYALALLRNPADAEDVTQTTFLNAYRAYKRGDEIFKPQNWLIKIAHNVARSRYPRLSRRVKEVPLDDHAERLATIEDEQPDVEGVLRALGRLPFNQRAALVMRELEGRSYGEIADTLGVSVAAVETLIFRARRSLRVRTAALRSIAAVPLPSSLTQFFEGGGGVAGAVGSGFLVKAAVALVAGALATGLSSEHRNVADAAPRKVAAAHSQTTASMTSVQRVASVAVSVRGSAKPGRTKRLPGSVRASRPDHLHRPTATFGGGAQPSRSIPTASAARSGPAASTASAPRPATTTAAASSAVQDTATKAADTVNQTVDAAKAAVPVAVPVAVPPVPPVPVDPPPLPKVP